MKNRRTEVFPSIVIPKKAMVRSKPQFDDPILIETVRAIVRAVRANGDVAIKELSKKYDKIRISQVRIKPKKADVSPALRKAMKVAYKRIIRYHTEFASSSRAELAEEGVVWGRVVRPIQRVGIYVPGGSAPLFSTLLMAAGAAKAAGVPELAVATPPPVNEGILAACEVAGITEIYQVGGAQAIAGLAFGTKSIKPVDKIVGPGNRYVTEAKRQVFGYVGIDSLAGPTDILILADDSASPEYLAADMIAQSEHGVDSQAILVTKSKSLAKKVQEEVARQLEDLPRRKIAAESIRTQSKIVICKTNTEMFAVSNYIAPEHLSIQLKDSWAAVDKITCAGAIFVGQEAPEALGDYITGPNHILPTYGTARFCGPLSTDDFLTTASLQSVTSNALKKLAGPAALMARAEELEGHARSLDVRIKKAESETKKKASKKTTKKPSKKTTKKAIKKNARKTKNR